MRTDHNTVDKVRDWTRPGTAKEVRKFLGLAGYYRKFVRNYGVISRPLTNLLKKNIVFVWTSLHEEAFVALKTGLTTAPVLALPDLSKPFILEKDASDCGIGAGLMQEQHPIAFLSKALGPKLQTLSTYEKECLAVILAVDKWRSYLQHAPFTLATDHRSLTHLQDQKISSPMHKKALLKLLGLRYNILYKKGQ